jgi:molybdate transport system substrate-binding protein
MAVRAIWVIIVAALFAAAPGAARAAAPVVAAASDLKFALEEIAADFKKDTGQAIKLSFGSSGTFATQIRNGAPFALFLSADEDYIGALHKDGYTRDAGVLYAIGRIVLMAPTGSGLPVDGELKGLAAELRAGRIRRFAIANPEHAPYGKRAEEVLRRAGLWADIEPRLVLGENISQAAQFAVSGSAQGGIIALSLAASPQMKALGRYALIPEQWHAPLRQRMVLLKQANAAAEAFYRYLQEPAARRVMRAYGFALPGEAG